MAGFTNGGTEALIYEWPDVMIPYKDFHVFMEYRKWTPTTGPERGKTDWDKVAVACEYSNGETAKTRIGQICRKYGFSANPTVVKQFKKTSQGEVPIWKPSMETPNTDFTNAVFGSAVSNSPTLTAINHNLASNAAGTIAVRVARSVRQKKRSATHSPTFRAKLRKTKGVDAAGSAYGPAATPSCLPETDLDSFGLPNYNGYASAGTGAPASATETHEYAGLHPGSVTGRYQVTDVSADSNYIDFPGPVPSPSTFCADAEKFMNSYAPPPLPQTPAFACSGFPITTFGFTEHAAGSPSTFQGTNAPFTAPDPIADDPRLAAPIPTRPVSLDFGSYDLTAAQTGVPGLSWNDLQIFQAGGIPPNAFQPAPFEAADYSTNQGSQYLLDGSNNNNNNNNNQDSQIPWDNNTDLGGQYPDNISGQCDRYLGSNESNNHQNDQYLGNDDSQQNYVPYSSVWARGGNLGFDPSFDRGDGAV